MHQCPHCEGFLPPQIQDHCPHCDLSLKKRFAHPLKRMGQLVLGAGAALTLSACYGAPPPASFPPCDDTNQNGQTTPPQPNDTSSPSEAPCATPSPTDASENTADTPE